MPDVVTDTHATVRDSQGAERSCLLVPPGAYAGIGCLPESQTSREVWLRFFPSGPRPRFLRLISPYTA